MAGPYVHCLVAREVLKQLFNDTAFTRYRVITSPDEDTPYFPYICLGSVSPDFPYPALRLGMNSGRDANGWTWGDKFHKQNTGNFVDIGIQHLQDIADKTSDAYLKRTAWLMGYYAHIITDLVIHAVVYEIVGGCYENHSTDHLHCEVVQDAWLFYDVYSNPPKELIESDFLKTIIEKCKVEGPAITVPTPLPTYVFDNEIATFWNSILIETYPDFYDKERPDIEAWYEEYSDVVRIATEVIARTVVPGMAYHKTTDISMSEKDSFYLHPKLPDGTTGDYRNRVFNKAVNEVTSKLKPFLNALDSSDSYNEFKNEIRPWNIDKGTIDDITPQFALWHGRTEYPFNCNGDPPAKRDLKKRKAR